VELYPTLSSSYLVMPPNLDNEFKTSTSHLD
jgi:hypothetical protein